MDTYNLRFFGPGLPLGLGVPSDSPAGADLLEPGLGPGTPFRLLSFAWTASPSSFVPVAGVVIAFDLSSLASDVVLGCLGVSEAFGFDLAGLISEYSWGKSVRRYEDNLSLTILLSLEDFGLVLERLGDDDFLRASGDEVDMALTVQAVLVSDGFEACLVRMDTGDGWMMICWGWQTVTKGR